MKIESHNLNMQSQHLSYRSILKSELSFESFIYDEPMQLCQPKETDSINQISDTFTTLNSIIQRLFQNLSKKLNQEISTSKNDAIGYTHISLYEKYEEFENVNFSTQGIVKTDKGELNLNLNFSMTRNFAVENKIDIYSEFDPLVINLNGEIPKLDSDTFNFDLDNDGETDQISKLKKGNGFLALDKNNDGDINNGSELFGTKSGDGFKDLKKYDNDNNDWIDENDSIFNKLRVWLKGEDDTKELFALGEVGIGAIYLNSQQSNFTYKTSQNTILGDLKSSGIFLHEDGSVGNIAQIDFTTHKSSEPLAELLGA